MAISSAAFAITVPNGFVAAPTAYTITGGDVAAGISIPPSFFTTALNYGQAGFVLERMHWIVTTTTPGTNFTVVAKATIATTDVANEATPFPLANAGDYTKNVNANGVYYLGPFTSGRFLQPDGSFLWNFTGTVGVTTIQGILDPYAPAGPRG